MCLCKVVFKMKTVDKFLGKLGLKSPTLFRHTTQDY